MQKSEKEKDFGKKYDFYFVLSAFLPTFASYNNKYTL